MDIDEPKKLVPFFSRLWLALSDGLGVYLVAMMALAVCAALIRYTDQILPRKEASTDFENLLSRPQEPTRDDTLPSLSGAVLANTITWDLCKDPQRRASRIADEAFELFQFRYEHPDKPFDNGQHTLAMIPVLDSTGLWNKPIQNDSASDRDIVPAKVDETPFLGKAYAEKLHLDAPPQSLLRIPSTIADRLSASPARLQDAVERSRQLEALGAIAEAGIAINQNKEKHDGGDKEGSRDEDDLESYVQGVYFISIDGAMRVVPPTGLEIKAHRTFVGASYFRDAVDQSPETDSSCKTNVTHAHRYDTKPYLDLLGNGVVTTSCYPVFGPIAPDVQRDVNPTPTASDKTSCEVNSAMVSTVVAPVDSSTKLAPKSKDEPISAAGAASTRRPVTTITPAYTAKPVQSSPAVATLSTKPTPPLLLSAQLATSSGITANPSKSQSVLQVDPLPAVPPRIVATDVAECCKKPPPADRALAGVFCVDLGVPLSLIRKNLLEQEMFSARLVSVVNSGSGPSSYSACLADEVRKDNLESKDDINPNFGTCDARFQAQTKDEVKALEARASEWVDETKSGKLSSSRAELLKGSFIAAVWEGPQNGANGVPWGRRRELAVLTLTPNVLGPKGFVALGGAVFLGLSALAVLLSSNRRQSRRREFMIGRTFQVGLLQLDTHDSIVAANDRAEELLGARLRRFGTPGATSDRPRMDEVINPTVFFQVEGGWRPRPYASVQADRQNGVSSAYFAYRQSAHNPTAPLIWLKITGSPMFDSAGNLHTFGVVELAPDEFKNALDEALAKTIPAI